MWAALLGRSFSKAPEALPSIVLVILGSSRCVCALTCMTVPAWIQCLWEGDGPLGRNVKWADVVDVCIFTCSLSSEVRLYSINAVFRKRSAVLMMMRPVGENCHTFFPCRRLSRSVHKCIHPSINAFTIALRDACSYCRLMRIGAT